MTGHRSAISRSLRSRNTRHETLSRTPDADFRVPTDEELDALVAYQLALGRQEDFNLPLLELKSPLASRWQDSVPGQRQPLRAGRP